MPDIWFICELRKAESAEFIEKLDVLPSARYMPVVSIATACLPRSSTVMAWSWLWMVMSSGASMVNSSPMF